MSKVVVIGGGVIGCAVAERLSFEGHQVTLFERDQLGSRASGAAAGELSPHSTTSAATESAKQSLELFPELIARIEKDSAMNVEYRVQSGLQPAFDQEEAKRLRAAGGRWLDAQACREAEPSLSTEVLGAVLLEHAHLTPSRFVRALARAAARRGAAIHEGRPAMGFERAGDEIKRVITPGGQRTPTTHGRRDREPAEPCVPVGAGPRGRQRLRPVTRNGFPIVDVMGARNLVIATGHHRKGILPAPLAAMNVASIVAAG